MPLLTLYKNPVFASTSSSSKCCKPRRHFIKGKGLATANRDGPSIKLEVRVVGDESGKELTQRRLADAAHVFPWQLQIHIQFVYRTFTVESRLQKVKKLRVRYVHKSESQTHIAPTQIIFWKAFTKGEKSRIV